MFGNDDKGTKFICENKTFLSKSDDRQKIPLKLNKNQWLFFMVYISLLDKPRYVYSFDGTEMIGYFNDYASAISWLLCQYFLFLILLFLFNR